MSVSTARFDPSSWVKDDVTAHQWERGRFGFSKYDWFNFNEYLTWVIIGGLNRFKTGSGHPVNDECQNMEDWCRLLDEMIDGFEARHKLDSYCLNDEDQAEMKAKWDRGSALFIRYYGNLWD